MTRTWASSAGSSSGGGYIVETPSGALYNQDTGTGGLNFVVTATPVYIVADGGTYFANNGYVLSGLNVTMDFPVSQYIRSFHQ
jgi:hypothetical protein